VPSDHVRNIGLDLVLTLITCGLFNIYLQYRQCEALNVMLQEQRYSFGMWLLLTIVTCGIYHVYHEYKKTSDIMRIEGRDGGEPILVAVLTLFGMSIVADAIQQTHINRHFGSDAV